MRRYRIYFNRLNEAPQVWSVDEGDQATEINVIAVCLLYCEVRTYTNLAEIDEASPKAWIEVMGTLRVEGGVATIRGNEFTG